MMYKLKTVLYSMSPLDFSSVINIVCSEYFSHI